MPIAEIPPNYDLSLRNVFRVGGLEFLKAIQVRIDRKLDTDVSKIRKRSVDLLGEHGNHIVHVEFQRSYNARMPIRMLDYYGSILAVLTLEDPKYLRYRLRQVLVHVANDQELKQTHRASFENVSFEFVSYNTLGIDATSLLDRGDAGDAVLSILCRGGSNPTLINRALQKISTVEQSVELTGMYLALSCAVPDGYVNVLNGVHLLGIEIDFEKIEPFKKQLDARLVDAAIEYFVDRASELFPDEVVSEEIKTALSEMPPASINSLRRALNGASSAHEAVLGRSGYSP